MYTIVTRSVPPCAFCLKAKELLDSKGLQYTEIDIAGKHTTTKLFKALGFTTIPQIMKDGKLVGDYEKLQEHLA